MLSTKSLLLATCLAAAPGLALAQSSTTQAPSSAQSPGMTQSAPAGSGSSMGAGSNMNESSATKPGSSTMSQTERSGTMGAGASSASMQPLSQPSANQIMISDLRGTTVYSSNNENVGDIKDIVITRDGKLEAMIVGVGGFLGIGEKNVAIPFQAFEISAERNDNATASTSAREPATTGSTSTSSTSTSSSATTSQGTMKPQRVVLRSMTKAELEQAPAFRADGGSSASNSSNNNASGANRNTTAPAR